MLKSLSIKSLLVLGACFLGTAAQSQQQYALKMAIGEPGSETFVFGTELWAMGQITLKHDHGIDLAAVEVVDDFKRLTLLHDADIQVALVSGDVSRSHASDRARTVMTLWPSGNADKGAKPAQIIVRADVADGVVYHLTKAIFENAHFFKASQHKFGTATPDIAVAGGDLPIHAGALRYYQEQGVELDQPMTGPETSIRAAAYEVMDRPKTVVKAASFLDFDDQALSEEERSQIAAACQQALDVGALSLVLGDLSSTGCEVYQSYLEDQEADRRDVALETDSFTHQGGQGGPAILLESNYRHGDRSLQKRASSRKPTM